MSSLKLLIIYAYFFLQVAIRDELQRTAGNVGAATALRET